MKKVYVHVISGPFVGFVGELVNGSVNVVLFNALHNIGMPEYILTDEKPPVVMTYDNRPGAFIFQGE